MLAEKVSSAGMSVKEVNVVDGCPAFASGCPFANFDIKALPEIMSSMPNGITEKCDAFKNGCPFKESTSVEALYNRLSDMPATHRPSQEGTAAKAVGQVLHLVHQHSQTLKVELNSQCPVFATSCPFKTITSDGAPLVQELDGIVTAWGLAEETAPAKANDGSPLSKSLKAGTKTVHRAAENVRFVREFLSGNVSRESYVELLRALYHVYHALESALDKVPTQHQHSDFAVLRRTETLEADLRFYTGTFDMGSPSPAAQQYVEHLQKLAVERPLMLLAHAYTRYLGDLSGGQILARAAVKAYGLSGAHGQAFYNFEQIGSSPQDVKAFKRGYRASLDALGLTAGEADALVEEANAAFLMNMLLFEERDVAAGHLKKLRTLDEAMELVMQNTTPLGFQRAYGDQASLGKKKGVCPFMPPSAGNAAGGGSVIAAQHGKLAVCPWPFVWLHDPHAAMVAHPVKNFGGLLALTGLVTAAWQYPRSVCGGLLGAGVLTLALKPPQHGH